MGPEYTKGVLSMFGDTPEQIASKLGVTVSTVERWFSTPVDLSPEYLTWALTRLHRHAPSVPPDGTA